jgi:hypothetical protein
MWVPIALQALAATLVVIGAMRHAIDPRHGRAFAVATVAALGVMAITPLPYFTAMLMPDVFAGLAVVAAAILLAGWRRETAGGRIGWIALAAFGSLAHASVTLILLATALLAGAAALLVRRRRILPGIAVGAVFLAAFVGLAGDAAFSAAVEHATGQPPIRPPFITARLTADGVGTAFLAEDCAKHAWAMCRYRDRLPLHSDSFLWSPSPSDGVFMASPPAEQRALAAEQMRFMAAVVVARPLDTLRSSAGAIAEQMRAAGMSEFNYNAMSRWGYEMKLPRPVLAQMHDTAAYRERMPTRLAVASAWPLTALGVAALIAVALAARRQPALRRFAGFGALAVTGWLLNDAVCGAISTPHDRYQMRVIWVVPLMAALAIAAWLDRERKRRATV